MTVAVAKPNNLVLNRGAIARTAALDLAGIHRGSMNVGPDDIMSCGRRAGDTTLDLGVRNPTGQHRKWLRRIITRLHFGFRPVDGGSVEPRRRTGFQAAQGKAN